ncbi:unnamed protein product [Candidula unifasciata]|uniref:RBR-type E3 ubiquitin transferase n=1 Tax=Candidula unifasciata TaxID=100452 RepID=A0A8S3ZMY7_9EUPU|nr:unnamed protein product [Candidula unifasciata]
MESAPNSRWCPNPNCGRIVKLGNQTSVIDASFDVTCDCGQEFCCLCLSQPHWPATCRQAEEYRQKLRIHKVPQEPAGGAFPTDNPSEPPQLERKNAEVMEIEGRVCPRCKKFIDKNGGCTHMSCKCGFQFCWVCLKEWVGHSICKPIPSVVFEHTRMIKVNHIAIPQISINETTASKQPKPVRSRQRTSMYQKALQQKGEASNCKYHAKIVQMVKELARLGQKDLMVKTEILTLCGAEVKDATEPSLMNTTFTPHVTKFLRSCVEVKRALHHVTEFTFVLAQDIPDSTDRRRILKLAEDLSSYCIFVKSILDLGPNQDVRVAVRRLADIQAWSRRTLTVLLGSVKLIRF